MRFEITVTVEAERTEGKFAARDDLLTQIIEAIESADPGTLEGENGGQYETVEWMVDEVPPPKRKAKRVPVADPSDAIIGAMADNLAYVRYVAACEAEGLDAHDLHMWEVHGRPDGPIGETRLQERSYEVERGGF